jgi:hypothetical protein
VFDVRDENNAHIVWFSSVLQALESRGQEYSGGNSVGLWGVPCLWAHLHGSGNLPASLRTEPHMEVDLRSEYPFFFFPPPLFSLHISLCI